MKIKNIVFSGFAAAILMGTVGANAAGTFNIASKAYVDAQTKMTVDNVETNVTSVVAGLAEDVAALNGNGANSVDSKIDAAVADALGDDFGGQDGYADVTTALADKADANVLGGNFSPSATVQDALDGKQDKLSGGTGYEGKVVTAGATNGAVTYTTVDTTVGNNSNLVTGAAVQAYVDNAIDGVTGDGGSVGSQIDTALGSAFTGENPTFGTVSDALDTKLDKSATSSTLPAAASAVATNYANELAVANALAGKQDAITQTNKLDADSVDDSNSTNKFVSASEKSTWNDKQDALSSAQLLAVNSGIDSTKVATYEALATILNGYTTCVNDNANASGHCVLTAAAASGNDPAGLSWVFVTDPWID